MRAREFGIEIGLGTPGPLNAITDVSGVSVGHETLIVGDAELAAGSGPVRTGVTVVVPHDGEISEEPLFAGCHRLNGNGELTGLEWVRESGLLTSPIALTNSHSVGVVRDALVRREIEARGPGVLFWSLPVVGETWDGCLNDINGQHVGPDHVFAALDAASGGSVSEGNVGGGTGMVAYDFKGGSGTASRIVNVEDRRYVVGALVQANHGARPVFKVNGVPIGQILDDQVIPIPILPEARPRAAAGSIIVVVATNAPLLPHQLSRLAQRAGFGVGAQGAFGDNYSGDIFIAFSTANRGLPSMNYGAASPTILPVEMLSLSYIDPFFQATAEATEEAILNAMLAAETMEGRGGVVVHQLDGERLVEILDRYDRRTCRPGHRGL